MLTGEGCGVESVVPIPSSPPALPPQQTTLRLARRAPGREVARGNLNDVVLERRDRAEGERIGARVSSAELALVVPSGALDRAVRQAHARAVGARRDLLQHTGVGRKRGGRGISLVDRRCRCQAGLLFVPQQ